MCIIYLLVRPEKKYISTMNLCLWFCLFVVFQVMPVSCRGWGNKANAYDLYPPSRELDNISPGVSNGQKILKTIGLVSSGAMVMTGGVILINRIVNIMKNWKENNASEPISSVNATIETNNSSWVNQEIEELWKTMQNVHETYNARLKEFEVMLKETRENALKTDNSYNHLLAQFQGQSDKIRKLESVISDIQNNQNKLEKEIQTNNGLILKQKADLMKCVNDESLQLREMIQKFGMDVKKIFEKRKKQK